MEKGADFEKIISSRTNSMLKLSLSNDGFLGRGQHKSKLRRTNTNVDFTSLLLDKLGSIQPRVSLPEIQGLTPSETSLDKAGMNGDSVKDQLPMLTENGGKKLISKSHSFNPSDLHCRLSGRIDEDAAMDTEGVSNPAFQDSENEMDTIQSAQGKTEEIILDPGQLNHEERDTNSRKAGGKTVKHSTKEDLFQRSSTGESFCTTSSDIDSGIVCDNIDQGSRRNSSCTSSLRHSKPLKHLEVDGHRLQPWGETTHEQCPKKDQDHVISMPSDVKGEG